MFSPDTTTTGLARVDAAGGTLVAITTLGSSKETSHRWPNFPDGNHFIYFAHGATSADRV